MPEKKVTREIADIIYMSYEALRLDKVKPEKALELIQSDIEKDFGVKLALGTIFHYSKQTFDKYQKTLRRYYQSEKGKESQRKQNQSEKRKEYKKRYHQSEKGKKVLRKAIRKYQQKMTKPRNPDFSAAIDVFTDLNVEFTSRQVWEKVGSRLNYIQNNLGAYYKANVLKRRREGNNFFYSLNPDSPFLVVVDGFYKEKEKEMFGK